MNMKFSCRIGNCIFYNLHSEYSDNKVLVIVRCCSSVKYSILLLLSLESMISQGVKKEFNLRGDSPLSALKGMFVQLEQLISQGFIKSYGVTSDELVGLYSGMSSVCAHREMCRHCQQHRHILYRWKRCMS